MIDSWGLVRADRAAAERGLWPRHQTPDYAFDVPRVFPNLLAGAELSATPQIIKELDMGTILLFLNSSRLSPIRRVEG